MLRDITLGQYYPADSVIHKLDPRVKLFSTMIYIISLFCFRGVAALAIATVFLITVIKLSKVPFNGKGIKGNHDSDVNHGGVQSVFDAR